MSEERSPYEPPSSNVDLPEPEGGVPIDVELPRSPLSPAGLRLLFLKPSHYFSNHAWLLKGPEVVIVAYVSGMAAAIARIDSRFVSAELKGDGGAAALSHLATQSWLSFWGIVLIAGFVHGLLVWYLGGWWYRMRLRLSGSPPVEPKHARAAYVHQDFVQSGPSLLFVIPLAFIFDDYGEYWQSGELLSTLLIVFTFWSCWTSYGAACSFPVQRWKARLWFLALPALFYLAIGGAVAGAYFWLAN